jgi:hypothetical protein
MSTWQDLVTASLIGTERAEVPPAGVPGVLTSDPVTTAQDPAAVLLDRAALLTAARRAGWRPGQAEPLAAAEPDPAPLVGPAAARRLARMLGGEHPDLLAEWLAAVVSRGLRAPAWSLPALLDRARRAGPAQARLRRLVAEAGGSRARWLAGLNPDWKFVTEPVPADEAWRLGDRGQRRSYLAALRARDPRAARKLIAASWKAADGDRAMFLSVLAENLSLADERLLETALGDPAEDVRDRAAYLLASLSGSALGQRMAGRARGFLCLRQGTRGMRLVVSPPPRSDASMRRDGITAGPAAGPAPQAARARLVLEVLARTPLRTWTDEFGLAPAQIAALPAGSWAPVLLAGWARAAIAQRDGEWITALVTHALAGPSSGPAADDTALRQLARRADPALAAPGALPDPEPGRPAVVNAAAAVLRFRYEMLKELDDDHGG